MQRDPRHVRTTSLDGINKLEAPVAHTHTALATTTGMPARELAPLSIVAATTTRDGSCLASSRPRFRTGERFARPDHGSCSDFVLSPTWSTCSAASPDQGVAEIAGKVSTADGASHNQEKWNTSKRSAVAPSTRVGAFPVAEHDPRPSGGRRLGRRCRARMAPDRSLTRTMVDTTFGLRDERVQASSSGAAPARSPATNTGGS